MLIMESSLKYYNFGILWVNHVGGGTHMKIFVLYQTDLSKYIKKEYNYIMIMALLFYIEMGTPYGF